MPLIRYICECGISKGKFYRAGGVAPGLFPCECGKNMKKILSGPSAESKVVLDNGVQARKVELNLDVMKDNENKARYKEKAREKP